MNRAKIALMLGVATILHNVEEAVGYEHYRSKFGQLISDRNLQIALPPHDVMMAALVAATVLPLAGLLIAARGAARAWKDFLLCWAAATLLVNAFVPHVTIAFATGGYVPGLASALILNVPVGIFVVRWASHGGTLTGRGVSLAFVAALATLASVAGGLLAVA